MEVDNNEDEEAKQALLQSKQQVTAGEHQIEHTLMLTAVLECFEILRIM